MKYLKRLFTRAEIEIYCHTVEHFIKDQIILVAGKNMKVLSVVHHVEHDILIKSSIICRDLWPIEKFILWWKNK